MRVRSMPADRFFGVTARLLAGAAALSVAGPGLVMWFAWRQSAQSYGPDGVATDLQVPVRDHLALVMLDFNYRQVGTQLLFASAMVGTAVVLLHRVPSWELASRLRWEVWAAGLMVLVPILGCAGANLYLVTSRPSGDGTEMWIAPGHMAEQALGPLAILAASLLVLVAAALGWLRLAPAATEVGGDCDDDPDVDLASSLVEDHRHDWSPEDFRPPSRPS